MGLEIDIAWLTLLLFGSLAVLLALGLPMAFCTGSLAVVFLFLFGNSAILNMMPSRIFPFMTDYQLSAVPLFIFMAAMLEKAGIIEELFDAVYKWLGAVKGGLAAATVLACTALAAMVGVVGATEVTMGMIAPGAAEARLRSEARLRLASRWRDARHPDPAVGHGNRLCGRGAAVARGTPRRLDLPRPAAVRALCRLRPHPLLHQSGARTGIAAGGARQPTRETATPEEHDRADPAHHPRARYHLRRHRNAGGGGGNRHIWGAVRVGVEPPPHLAGDRGGRHRDAEGDRHGDVDLFRRHDVRWLLHREGRPGVRGAVDPRHRSAALRHPDAHDGDPVRARDVPRLGRHPAAYRADLPADHEKPAVGGPVRAARRSQGRRVALVRRHLHGQHANGVPESPVRLLVVLSEERRTARNLNGDDFPRGREFHGSAMARGGTLHRLSANRDLVAAIALCNQRLDGCGCASSLQGLRSSLPVRHPAASSALIRPTADTRVRPDLHEGRSGHGSIAGECRGGAQRADLARALRLLPRRRHPQGGGGAGAQARLPRYPEAGLPHRRRGRSQGPLQDADRGAREPRIHRGDLEEMGPRHAPLSAADDDHEALAAEIRRDPYRRPVEGHDHAGLHERRLGPGHRRAPQGALRWRAFRALRGRGAADHGHGLRLPQGRQF